MNVLVTGGAGFIGSHLVDALVAAGHQVRVLDDLSNGVRENVNPDAELLVGSLADPDAVARAVAGTELVFHLGALGAVSRSVADPLTTDRVNVHGTLSVLKQAVRRRGPPGGVRVVEQRLRRGGDHPDARSPRRCGPVRRTR